MGKGKAIKQQKGSVDKIHARNLYNLIGLYPGSTKARLAKLLNCTPGAIDSRLPGLENAGLLLYEDDKGGLYRVGVDLVRWQRM